jgi:NhaP-type Na+/H+ or K+/H+ antiporter
MAKGLKLSSETFATLSIECALSDVLAVTMAFGFLLAAGAGKIDALTVSSDILLSLLVGALIGAAGGVVWLALLNTIRSFPNTTLTTIGFLLLVSAVTDTLHFSGAISAFFFGLMLANYHELLGDRVERLRGLSFTSITESEHAVFQELIFILKTFFFVYLGISVTMEYTLGVWVAAGVVAVLGLLRILVVRASLPSRLGWREMGVVSQMFPKGLAAAVLASVPAEQGLLLGDAIRGVVYSTLIFSIIWTTVLVPLIERTGLGRAFQGAFGKAALETETA